MINLLALRNFIFVYNFETPKFLLLKNKGKAKICKVLEKIYQNKEKVEKKFERLNNELEDQLKKPIQWKDLMNVYYLKPIAICMLITFFAGF